MLLKFLRLIYTMEYAFYHKNRAANPMRIAVISDIHANLTALEAVAEDIETSGADTIICLGDITTLGPEPRACLKMVQDLNCRCITGNHDAFMTDPGLLDGYTDSPMIRDLVTWARGCLSREELDFIRSFDSRIELAPEPDGKWLFFHGSPHSHMTDILSTTPPDDLDGLLGGESAELMCCGHTHIQMLRQHKGGLIVNPGSVGLPFREYVGGKRPELLEHAEYAVLEKQGGNINVSLRRIQYSREAFKESVACCGGIIAAFCSRFYD